jgi:hypothetical protein
MIPLLERKQAELGELYERDYYSWTDVQVRALRERKIAQLDWENLAEEVEDFGKAERHRLESHLESLLMHLLKWVYQPRRRSRSWSNSTEEHRFGVRKILRENPGLKSHLAEIFTSAYESARFGARNETGLDLTAFPESLPLDVGDPMREDFWPAAAPKPRVERRRNRSRRR